MINDILNEADGKMDKSVETTREEFSAIRAGRANPAMFSKIMVDYYGTPTPIQSLASFTSQEARVILVSPYDVGAIGNVERAIRDSDLGVNPANDGKLIRIPIPPLTEERRKQLVKKVHGLAEEAKTAIRHIRREANDELKRMEKDGDLSSDDARRTMDEVQKATDKHTGSIEDLSKNKEKELMEV